MKAIKDCEWEVKIETTANPVFYKRRRGMRLDWLFYWEAKAGWIIITGRSFKEKQPVKRDWKRFAEINGLKKWKILEE